LIVVLIVGCFLFICVAFAVRQWPNAFSGRLTNAVADAQE